MEFFSDQTKMEYLVLLVTQNLSWTKIKNVEAMVNMMPPENKFQVYAFILSVNYYRYIWSICSHLLQTLTTLTSDKYLFKWTDIEHKAFQDIKRIVTYNTLLAYPDLNECLYIYTDTSNFQLEVVISQEGKPISFYIRKPIRPQTWYT